MFVLHSRSDASQEPLDDGNHLVGVPDRHHFGAPLQAGWSPNEGQHGVDILPAQVVHVRADVAASYEDEGGQRTVGEVRLPDRLDEDVVAGALRYRRHDVIA